MYGLLSSNFGNWSLFIKGVPIFISASAISAYRHFFSISAYRLSANNFTADIADISISAIQVISAKYWLKYVPFYTNFTQNRILEALKRLSNLLFSWKPGVCVETIRNGGKCSVLFACSISHPGSHTSCESNCSIAADLKTIQPEWWWAALAHDHAHSACIVCISAAMLQRGAQGLWWDVHIPKVKPHWQIQNFQTLNTFFKFHNKS